MDSQVQTLDDLAKLISADIVKGLRLDSDGSIFKIVLKELSKLAESATDLRKEFLNLNSAFKTNPNVDNKNEAANVSALERQTISGAESASPAINSSEDNNSGKNNSEKGFFEKTLEKALSFVSSPKGPQPDVPKSFLENSIEKALSVISSSKDIRADVPKETIIEAQPAAPKKSFIEQSLEKALSFVSSPKGPQPDVPKSFLENSIEKALSLVSSSKQKEEPSSEKTETSSTEKKTGIVENFIDKIVAISKTIEKNQSIEASTDDSGAPKSELKAIEKPKEVLITGLGEQAISKFKLPSFLDGFKNLDKTLKDVKNGIGKVGENIKDLSNGKGGLFESLLGSGSLKALLPILGGAALVLGGLASLVAAFNTDSEMKGTLETVGKLGIRGGLTILAKNIAKLGTKFLAKIPVIGSIISFGFALQRFSNGDIAGGILDVASGIASLFPGIGTTVSIGIDILQAILDAGGGGGAKEAIAKGAVRGGLTILAKNITKLGVKFLGKIPIIGSLISFGFALQRFSNGDIVGGLLDVGSGIASLFPGVGTVISIGIDVLQSILDAKGGGSSAEASGKKGSMLLDWAKSIGGFIDDNIKYIPVIGSLYSTGKALMKGEWKKALIEFSAVVPGLQIVKMLIGEETYNAAVENTFVSIGNWFKEIGNFIDEKIKYMPILGPLYYAGKSLLKGDFKKALFEFTTLFPPLQFVRAFMTEQEVAQASENLSISLGSWFKEIGNFIDEKIKVIPILGPLYYTGKSLLKGNWKQAFFEFITILPPLQFIRSLMSEEEYSAAAEGVVTNIKGWIQSIKDWIYEKVSNLPVIGPLIAAIETVIEDPIGVLEAMPGGKSIVSFFKFATSGKVIETAVQFTGNIFNKIADWVFAKVKNIPVIGPIIETITSAMNDPVAFVQSLPGGEAIMELFASGNVVGGMFKIAGNVLDKVADWVLEKIEGLPVIGPLIRGIKLAINDPLEFLKMIPGGELIISFFEGAKSLASSAISTVGNFASSLADKVKNLFSSILDSIMNGFLNLIPETVSVFGVEVDIRRRVAEFLGIKSGAAPSKESAAPSSSAAGSSPTDSSVKQLNDSAIDPQGGLIVSSPGLGALYQLNKKDGIVAGPMMDDGKENITSVKQKGEDTKTFLSGLFASNNQNNDSNSILERIANNTALSNQNISNLITGFNNLAKALERTLGESASVPMVATVTNNQDQSIKPTSSQYANVGNSDIANFRTNFIEGARFRPA